MNELALFAGAGGGILAGKLLGWSTVAAVEIDPYCREVLLRRQLDGMLDLFPIWDDVRTFDGRPWRGLVDVVSAGFPCQPFSAAGKRAAAGDPRNMWPETARVLREVRPPFAFLENVPGLLGGSHGYFGRVLGELADLGFDARWGVFSSAGVGAPHLRRRLWVVAAHAARARRDRRGAPGLRREARDVAPRSGGGNSMADADVRCPRGDTKEIPTRQPESGCGRALADTDGGRCEVVRFAQPRGLEGTRRSIADGRGEVGQLDHAASMVDADDARCTQQRGPIAGEAEQPPTERAGWRSAEPRLGRVAHGVAHRVDRLRAIGNGQDPDVAVRAWIELQRYVGE